jgi:hypothetical protein
MNVAPGNGVAGLDGVPVALAGALAALAAEVPECSAMGTCAWCCWR